MVKCLRNLLLLIKRLKNKIYTRINISFPTANLLIEGIIPIYPSQKCIKESPFPPPLHYIKDYNMSHLLAVGLCAFIWGGRLWLNINQKVSSHNCVLSNQLVTMVSCSP